MRRPYIYKRPPFMGIFLTFIILLIIFSIQISYKRSLSASSIDSSSEIEASPEDKAKEPPTYNNDTNNNIPLFVRGENIYLGESKESLIKKLGAPGRIDKTEYNFNYYIYNNNYNKLVFVAVSEETVVGYYTDSLDFNLLGISPSSDINEVNECLGSSYKLDEVLIYEDEKCTIIILMDTISTEKVVGIYVLSNEINYRGFTSEIMRAIELQVYDLTNSIRSRNSIPILSWSSSAALASRKHSEDMAHNNFFSHIDPKNRGPGERISAEGIFYSASGENIIGGYGTAIISTHGWFNSHGHRDCLLNEDFRYLGVGFTYHQDSIYETYITQNFYR